jgi:hypothetical protein
MRTPHHHSVSSAGRFSAWLVAGLGLAAYVGLIYGLTVFPLQFELPVPQWATVAVPAVAYGLLVLLFVRRPTIIRWVAGTALLTGLHVALLMARGPLSVMLDPALSGRPLPWMLPPPLPELVGVFLLLVPLRDLLRARPRLARERISGSSRASSSVRARVSVVPRVPQAAPSESLDSPKDLPVWERSAAAESVEVPAPRPVPAAAAPSEPVRMPAPSDETSRRAAARTERRPEAVKTPPRRSDVVLRIALDRIMGQLPPGTFLAPEDEVAAALRDPGYLLIPGELVVTQLSEGVARIAWNDIVDQFPSRLVGLSPEEISEHLGEGLRLPLDEVVGQLPHELFVADTPEVDIAGLDRIPVPFQPMEDSTPAPSLSQAVAETRPATPPVEEPSDSVPAAPAPEPTVTPEPAPPVAETRAPAAPAAPKATPAPPPAAQVQAPSAPVQAPVPPVAGPPTPSPVVDEPTVAISFARVASELPADAFNVSLDQVAGRMRKPDALLVPQSLVLSQLAEGLIRVKWDAVATQFPREALAISDPDMMGRLPNGITLPLDEVIGQIPPDLFIVGGPAVDLHGLESFPAPFQPAIADPAPQKPKAEQVDPPVGPGAAPVEEPYPLASAHVIPPPAVEAPAPANVATDRLVEEPPVTPLSAEHASHPAVVETPRAHETSAPEVVPLDSEPVPDPVSISAAEWPEPPLSDPATVAQPDPPAVSLESEPAIVVTPPAAVAVVSDRAETSWRPIESPAPEPDALTSGMTEPEEARRIVTLLAPIASFDVSIQSAEGVTVYALSAPRVAPEIAVAGAGLALPLFTERLAPWSIDQITFRGPETALVLTAVGSPGDRRVLAAAVPRGGGLALLEILCRRAAGDHGDGAIRASIGEGQPGSPSLAATSAERVAALTSSLTAFGEVIASALRDIGGEGLLYLFLPTGADVAGIGALAQDVEAIMRKAAGSGAVFRTAVLRSGRTLLVVQPEEVAHGRSIIVVAGGEVSRPGLAYRQLERVTVALAQA